MPNRCIRGALGIAGLRSDYGDLVLQLTQRHLQLWGNDHCVSPLLYRPRYGASPARPTVSIVLSLVLGIGRSIPLLSSSVSASAIVSRVTAYRVFVTIGANFRRVVPRAATTNQPDMLFGLNCPGSGLSYNLPQSVGKLTDYRVKIHREP